MVAELSGVGAGLIKGADTFPGAQLGRQSVAASSVTEQRASAGQEVQIKAVTSTLIALSDVKDVAARAANSVREANKVLGNAVVAPDFSQTDQKAPSDTQKAPSDTQKAPSDTQGSISTQADNPEQTKSSTKLTQEQIAYLARLNAGRAALQAQIDKLIGVLHIDLQQLVSESQAQIVSQSISGQLGIAPQPMVSNNEALKQLRE